jgi:glycerophosphoryl diester phosphodiesterase
MLLISHRGNISGPQPKLENTVAYIEQAINQGFDVEIDVWFQDGKFFPWT